MFTSLKKVWFGAGKPEGCAGCDPAILAQCKEPEAGTVTPHAHHVFVKLPAAANIDTTTTDDVRWPEKIEDETPAVAELVAGLKDAGERIHGKVKVTAFDYLEPTFQPAGTADVYIFPEGLLFKALPLKQLTSTVVEAVASATHRRTGGGMPPAAEQQAAQQGGTPVSGTVLFVCCHAKRDARCGHIGPLLAARLAELIDQKGLAGGVDVLKTSHIGGHAYAGNVVVFSHGKLYHGDWFGGVNPDNAAAFLDALLACKSPHGAPGDYSLRHWWRGRIGMTKEQQVDCFKKGVSDIEELASGSID